jgi:hypothetical protein
MQTEPLITIGSITGAVTAIIALLVAYNVSIDETQTKAILGVVAVVAPFVVAFAGRGKVSSPATVDRETRAAYASGLADASPKDDVEAVAQGRA